MSAFSKESEAIKTNYHKYCYIYYLSEASKLRFADLIANWNRFKSHLVQRLLIFLLLKFLFPISKLELTQDQ